MIKILNPKVSPEGVATADLNIHSACCKTILHIVAHYKNGVFSEAINIDNGVTIYVQVQNNLVKAWLEYIKQNE